MKLVCIIASYAEPQKITVWFSFLYLWVKIEVVK